MSWIQALIIGLLYYLSDAPWFFGEGFYVLQRPVVAGFLTGIVLGDPVQGAVVGATINLVYLGLLNVGGSMPSDMAIAGFAGTAIALTSGVSAEVALSIAVPLGILGTIWWVGKMSVDSIFVHWADGFAAKGDGRGVRLMNWLPSAIVMCVFKVIVMFIICMFGTSLIGSFLDAVQNTGILHGFEVIGGILPALGIALNLGAILKKDTAVYLLVGFLLVAYFKLSIIGVALFGLVFAVVYLQSHKDEDQKEIENG